MDGVRIDARALDAVGLRAPLYVAHVVAIAAVIAGIACAIVLADAARLVAIVIAACIAILAQQAGSGRRGYDLLLVVGELEIALAVTLGREAAELIAEDVRYALEPYAAGTEPRPSSPVVIVDGEPVRVDGEHVHIGRYHYRAEDVRTRGLRGENLYLGADRAVQAAVIMLAIQARRSRS